MEISYLPADAWTPDATPATVPLVEMPIQVTGELHRCDHCDRPAVVTVTWAACRTCGGAGCGDSGDWDYLCAAHWATSGLTDPPPDATYTVTWLPS